MMKKYARFFYLTAILCLILSMNYKKIGEFVHEILGLVIVIFALIHAFFRRKNLAKFNRKFFRSILNLTLLFTLCATFVSAVFLSEYIFAFADFGFGSDSAKNIHMFATHLLFLLASIHIGLNLKILVNLESIKFNKFVKFALFLALLSFGIYSFVDLHFYEYLFFKVGFGLENKNSLILSICEYLAIFFAIIFAVRVSQGGLFRPPK